MTESIEMNIERFLRYQGLEPNRFEAGAATLYLGLLLEEVAETLSEVSAGAVTQLEKGHLAMHANMLSTLAGEFKRGLYRGDVLRCNRTELLDGVIDAGWVALSAAYLISNDGRAAIAEVGRANLDKFPGGFAARDENGKVIKPKGWRAPDLAPFVDPPID